MGSKKKYIKEETNVKKLIWKSGKYKYNNTLKHSICEKQILIQWVILKI